MVLYCNCKWMHLFNNSNMPSQFFSGYTNPYKNIVNYLHLMKKSQKILFLASCVSISLSKGFFLLMDFHIHLLSFNSALWYIDIFFLIGFLCPIIQWYILKIGCIYPWFKNAIISMVYKGLLRFFFFVLWYNHTYTEFMNFDKIT